jgi:hypothetical protein
MALTRVQHWDTRALHEFLLARASAPFAWGAHDCALFAADAIQAMTGVDIAEDFRGKYSDEAGAIAAIGEVCGGSTVADAAAYCAQKHGLAEWGMPLLARRGDLVVVRNGDGSLIAGLIHLNGRHIVAAGEKGLLRLPIRNALRAWHVGAPEHVNV